MQGEQRFLTTAKWTGHTQQLLKTYMHQIRQSMAALVGIAKQTRLTWNRAMSRMPNLSAGSTWPLVTHLPEVVLAAAWYDALSWQHPLPAASYAASAGVSQAHGQERLLLHDEVLTMDIEQVEQVSTSEVCLVLWHTGQSLSFAGPSRT